MTGVLMKFGRHRFQAKGPSYQSFEQSFAARISEIELISGAPAYQFHGPGKVTGQLDGVIYPFAQKGSTTFEALQNDQAAGRVMMLVSGYGKVFGPFMIESLSLTETMAFTRGEPQKIEFSLSLVRIPQRFEAASTAPSNILLGVL